MVRSSVHYSVSAFVILRLLLRRGASEEVERFERQSIDDRFHSLKILDAFQSSEFPVLGEPWFRN